MELLAPAGGMDQLKAALRFGADAVYGGMQSYGLRAAATNFDDETLPIAVSLAHDAGAKFYVTMNLLPTDADMEGFLKAAKVAFKAGVDAVIISDIGAASMLHEHLPDLPLHISTQANVLNSYTAKHLHHAMGAERIVLSRELSLADISDMRSKLPDTLEIEAFVHGAMCVAYSGRCLLSSAIIGRSGNRGQCAQPCRWQYHVVEEKRPGEYYPVIEEERGTSLFSAYDLCMLPHLPKLKEAGIVSLKIEGRMKTAYYVAAVVSTYRHALDLLENEGIQAFEEAVPALMVELEKASHRASNTGFYFGQPTPAGGAQGFLQSMQYVGDVISNGDENTPALIKLKNRFSVGDTVEVLTPKASYAFEVTAMTLQDKQESVKTASVAGTLLYVPIPHKVQAGDLLRIYNAKHQTGKQA